MQENLIKLITITYAGVGVMGLIAYWPTMRDLYFLKKPSANATSFFIWTLASGISLLYGIFILHDSLYCIVTGAHFVACTIIIFLILGLKKKP